MDVTIRLVILIVSVLAVAFFSSSEASLTSFSKTWARHMALAL